MMALVLFISQQWNDPQDPEPSPTNDYLTSHWSIGPRGKISVNDKTAFFIIFDEDNVESSIMKEIRSDENVVELANPESNDAVTKDMKDAFKNILKIPAGKVNQLSNNMDILDKVLYRAVVPSLSWDLIKQRIADGISFYSAVKSDIMGF